MRRAVVLLSGGLDSATVVAIARADGYEVAALTVIYGQRHHTEIEAAKRVAAQQVIATHRFVTVDLGAIGGSALTADIEVPKDRDESEMADIPVTYVPARNTVMLAIALGFDEVTEAEAIYVGVNAVDYSGYPDCRPEYLAAFQNLAQLATKAGVEGGKLDVVAPLIHLRKDEIIARGLDLGVDYSITHSCYDPDLSGRACGRCDSCTIRLTAFKRLGISDPAPYQ
jgi:7-cyano-7-deazaguanine synthase